MLTRQTLPIGFPPTIALIGTKHILLFSDISAMTAAPILPSIIVRGDMIVVLNGLLYCFKCKANSIFFLLV